MTADQKPILLLGAEGQVGRALLPELEMVGTVIPLDRKDADLSRPRALAGVVARFSPGIIVNAAAYTAVDRAEKEADLAHTVNAVAPGMLAEAAEATGAWLVHYSTDYVFDGTLDRPYREDDATGPLSVYGATKLEGERAIASHTDRYVVLRTSWVFSAHGSNFVKSILRLAAERETLGVVDDQVGFPTSAMLIARVTRHCLERRAPLAGIYHLTASGSTSWCGFAQRIVERARGGGLSLTLAKDGIRPIPTRDYPTPARRPLNSRLDTRRLCSTLDLVLPDWTQDVDAVISHLVMEQSW